MAATGFVIEIAIAERIIRWCHRGQRSEFTRRQAQRDLRISRVEEMGEPLRLLDLRVRCQRTSCIPRK
jgi:hypothetical protein